MKTRRQGGRNIGDITRSAGLKNGKRQRLIQAAIEEFNEYGLDNASYNRIIERSGLSKGTVYYYFDNKDALLGTVMEEIGNRVLEAVPDRELPEKREEYWGVLWDYRQKEFDFFASNPSLGHILLLSLDLHDPEALSEEMLAPPLARLIQRQKELIQRGQELGLVRRDMDIGLIFRLIKAMDRSMCLHFFGRETKDIKKLTEAEKEARSRAYNGLFRDLMRRLLCPPEEFPSIESS